MKAELKFDLPEENSEFQAASHGMEWALVVFGFSQYLRNCIKYADGDRGENEIYAEMRDRLNELIEEYNLSLDMIE